MAITSVTDWVGEQPLSNQTIIPVLDLEDFIGIRTATYRFRLFNGVTDEDLGDITPYVQGARLSHDVNRTVKRDLTFNLGVEDADTINPLTDRVEVFMLIGGQSYPLGRYMFTDDLESVSTAGNQASVQMVDEMFIVDQPIENSFGNTFAVEGVRACILRLLAGLPIDVGDIAQSPFSVSLSAFAGSRRGSVLATLAQQGDYETPWMDNYGQLRMIRTVDAAAATADFDYDTRHQIYRDSISRSTDILNAPNRFVVVSSSSNAATNAIVGVYDVPPSAPHSIPNRGFVIPQVIDAQAVSSTQAVAMARNIGIRFTATETVQFTTPPDPRHDSYDVVLFDGEQWLETAWSMSLTEGGDMGHTIIRAYL